MALRFSWEKLVDLLKEPNLKDLLAEHFEEIAQDKESIALDVQWRFYLDREEQNILKITTARDGKRLVGYCAYYVDRHPGYRALYAWDGPYYLAPEYRGGIAGVRMMLWGEKDLKAWGVKRIVRHEKVEAPRSMLFAIMGYHPYELRWSKVM